MINEIQTLLKQGNVVYLECINENKFLDTHNDNLLYKNKEILNSKLKVKSCNDNCIFIEDCFHFISKNEFKYFKIKEPYPTFNDVIDVTVKGYKDRVLDIFLMNEDELVIFNYDKTGKFKKLFKHEDYNYKDFIKFIKSLYNETLTFTIENKEDIAKVNIGAEIETTNGFKLIAELVYEKDNKWFIDSTNDDMNITIDFLLLKGATVTQRKGIDND